MHGRAQPRKVSDGVPMQDVQVVGECLVESSEEDGNAGKKLLVAEDQSDFDKCTLPLAMVIATIGPE